MIPGRWKAFCAVVFGVLFLSSCLKQERPIDLPPAGTATQQQVTMGENYETQVFFDLENEGVVKTSDYRTWTLGLESQPGGTHVFINGGVGVFAHKTASNDFAVTPAIPGAGSAAWLMDDPNGNPAQTAIGSWKDSNAVYLLKLSNTEFYKVQFLTATATAWTFRHGRPDDPTGTLATVYKDPAFHCVYFNLLNGAGVQPDATRESWDILFTRYRYIYRDLNNTPYYVTGVLLNPHNVTAACDSTTAFASIDAAHAATLTFSSARDVIGFDWKQYDFNSARFVTRPEKNYVVRTRNGQLWKLHFLDFYSATGVKGSPTFEVERIQ